MRSGEAGTRERSLEVLQHAVFDVLVIGGGIVGARVAYEAARAGLRTALVDAGDFGGATSGASGKLVHGCLRYLKRGHLRLARRAQLERHALSTRIAPHLVRPLPFLLASNTKRLSFPALAAGLFGYWALDGFRGPAPRLVSAGRARSLAPHLTTNGPHALFYEAQTDDSRLTLATVKAAARAGSVVVNHLRVLDLEPSKGGVSRALAEGREGTVRIRYRAAVNATGPWMDRVRRLEDPAAKPTARLSKGVHLVLPLPEGWRAAVALPTGGGRAIYAVPHHGNLVLGATDTPYYGDPANVAPTDQDVACLLDEATRFLPAGLLREEALLHAFAGLRVLPPGGGDTDRAPRNHVLSVGPSGMVSVAGGKLTTHRLIAFDALRRLPTSFHPNSTSPCEDPIPGASADAALIRALHARLAAKTADHLLRLYGDEAVELLGHADRYPDALDRVHPDGPDLWAQVHHAVRAEWAVTVEDVTHRRTTLALRGLDTPEVRRAISTALERATVPN